MLSAMQTDDASWPDDLDKALKALEPNHAFTVPGVLFAKITDEACGEMEARFAGQG